MPSSVRHATIYTLSKWPHHSSSGSQHQQIHALHTQDSIVGLPLVVRAGHRVERPDLRWEPVEEKKVRPELLCHDLAEGQLLCARQIVEVVHLVVKFATFIVFIAASRPMVNG